MSEPTPFAAAMLDRRAAEIAKEVDPAAGGFFRTLLTKSARMGLAEAPTNISLRAIADRLVLEADKLDAIGPDDTDAARLCRACAAALYKLER